MEWRFSILDGRMGSEDMWYITESDHDKITGLKVITYNLMVVSNIEFRGNKRKIIKIVSCTL